MLHVHHRRRLGATLTLILTTATAGAASAEPSKETPDEAPLELPPGALVLALGGGPLLGGASGGAVGGLGGLGGWSPIVSGGFEARLVPRLWLVGDLQGAVRRELVNVASFGEATATNWSAGANVGIRHVLTDPEPLEVSWVLVASGQYGETAVTSGHEGWSWSAGMRAGLVLQHHFTDWLALRARVDLLKTSYRRSRFKYPDNPQPSDRGAWDAEVTAEPSIGMRFGF